MTKDVPHVYQLYIMNEKYNNQNWHNNSGEVLYIFPDKLRELKRKYEKANKAGSLRWAQNTTS